MKHIITIILTILVIGCGLRSQQEEPKVVTVEDRIIDWQEREGTLQGHLPEITNNETHGYSKTRAILKQIIDGFPTFQYVGEAEGEDHWQTSQEFVNNNYQGDCEDVSIFVYRQIRESQLFNDNDVAIRFVGDDYNGYHVLVVIYTTGQPLFISNGKLKLWNAYYDVVVYEYNLFTIW